MVRSAGKSQSTAELRAENEQLRTDVLTSQEDLKQTMKAHDRLDKKVKDLEEHEEASKEKLARASTLMSSLREGIDQKAGAARAEPGGAD